MLSCGSVVVGALALVLAYVHVTVLPDKPTVVTHWIAPRQLS
jgi:hypothetical protein